MGQVVKGEPVPGAAGAREGQGKGKKVKGKGGQDQGQGQGQGAGQGEQHEQTQAQGQAGQAGQAGGQVGGQDGVSAAIVEKWFPEKQFGFIHLPGSEEDHFFHASALAPDLGEDWGVY